MPQHKTICILTETADELELIFKTAQDDSWSEIAKNILAAYKKQAEFLDWIRSVLPFIRKETSPGFPTYDDTLAHDLIEKLKSALT